MPSQTNLIPLMPIETARHARAIYGESNFYIQVGEQLKAIMEDIEAESLFETGAVFPLTTFFQFVESLTDIQAVDAVRTRLDWKFALHLRVYSPVFHESALCKFRQKILTDPASQHEFQRLIDRLITFNHHLNIKFQEVENLKLVSTVCSVNRVNWIHGAICQIIGNLACISPLWLRKIALPHWYGRYNDKTSWLHSTMSPDYQELPIQEFGSDIHYLLEEVRCSGSDEIKVLKEIKMLDYIWKWQFEKSDLIQNDKSDFSKLTECDSCIYKGRMDWEQKYK